ncbi:MAG: hypothetical protein ACRCZS_20805 [Chroococcidiopsis sp.]
MARKPKTKTDTPRHFSEESLPRKDAAQVFNVRTFPGTKHLCLFDLADMCALDYVEWLKNPSTQELINNFKNDPRYSDEQAMYAFAEGDRKKGDRVSLGDPNVLFFVHPELALQFVRQLGGEEAEVASRMIRKALMKIV